MQSTEEFIWAAQPSHSLLPGAPLPPPACHQLCSLSFQSSSPLSLTPPFSLPLLLLLIHSSLFFPLSLRLGLELTPLCPAFPQAQLLPAPPAEKEVAERKLTTLCWKREDGGEKGPLDLSSHLSMPGVQNVLSNTSREYKYPTTVSLVPALSLG